jgi:large conductance mechanosensitive channel
MISCASLLTEINCWALSQFQVRRILGGQLTGGYDVAERQKIITRREVTVSLPVVKVPRPFQGFVDFVREQGVIGLAVGLVLGVAAKSVVDSIVNNIFNPIIGVLTGGVDLSDRFICIKSIDSACVSKVGYGQLISDLISFLTIAAVVYFVVKGLKLDKLDKKKG